MAHRGYRVLWTLSARSSLDEAVAYIAKSSNAGARGVLNAGLAAAEGLRTFAWRGRAVPEYGDTSVREVFVVGFRLIYRVGGDTVYVLGFIHGARVLTEGTDDPSTPDGHGM